MAPGAKIVWIVNEAAIFYSSSTPIISITTSSTVSVFIILHKMDVKVVPTSREKIW
jgi:hypothetical protein